MKRLNKLLPLFFLLPIFSLAQSNYRAGYVVTTTGDTVRGFIDFRNWGANPDAISFKHTIADGTKKTYGLNDITFFSVDGFVAYKKYTCKISMDITDINHIIDGRDTSFKTATVFLKVLQKEKYLALYSYADDLKTRFFIGEAPDYTPIELTYRLYYNMANVTYTSGRTVNENTYQKQLFALAAKYNALDDDLTFRLQRSNYEASDLLTIVSKINGISKSEFQKRYADKSRVSFFIGASANISATSSSQGSPYTAAGGPSYTSVQPMVSLGVNFVPNPVTGALQIRLGLEYAGSKFNTAYTLKVSPYIPVRASYNQTSFSIVPKIIYNFYNAGNLKIYGGVGFVYSHFSYSNSSFGSQNPSASDNGIGETDPYYFNTTDDAFLLQAGVQFNKRFEIFASYATATAATAGGYWALSTQSSQVGIIVLFGK